MALAGIGAGYAAWTDTIYIKGTVNTGTVDLNVVAYSGTWVYKVYPHDIFTWHGWANPKTGEPMDDIDLLISEQFNGAEKYELIAYATAYKAGNDKVQVVWYNLFPCIDFWVDIVFHYDGSIPARIATTTDYKIIKGQEWIGQLEADGGLNAWCYRTEDPTPYIKPDLMPKYEEVWIGYQLHQCNYFKLDIWAHLPQDPYYMGKSGKAVAQIEVVQWNEYDYYPQGD
ncbi:hypothetical protein DRJ16_06895 [Candidatus Woesearchaeota archaeon]|nr:MAG: hypothetical protein DRJ16_06895 [Candidatus Woesearchaeota archaeon]